MRPACNSQLPTGRVRYLRTIRYYVLLICSPPVARLWRVRLSSTFARSRKFEHPLGQSCRARNLRTTSYHALLI